MTSRSQHFLICQVCHKSKPQRELLPGHLVREELLPLICEKAPDWSSSGYICYACLNQIRTNYIRHQMRKDLGELDDLEQEVVASLENKALLSENIDEEYDQTLSFGECVADKVAEFGGSWRFIISFSTLLVVWIILNTVSILLNPFDPYPYILLNLVLSLLAAFQALQAEMLSDMQKKG
ncbi:uncharacterized protein DUF1003 [Thiogranum longum]|uniref:Uncharacterized protein DUF1003 n=1 Tax=Thiogranum longum TaxID=1537524 RepID=A0A4R1HG35_9GAMM|nr:DUF1003 domain-containing protein [Thiogranum longum]TCK19210.1 uncharacterized protein DUF1003 [Thiogranum longum]